MANGLLEMLVNAYAEPDSNPYLFEVGQTVRVLKKVVDDGQTPAFWAGLKVKIEARRCTGLHKDHLYSVCSPEGQKEIFKEEELDYRFCRKAKALAS